eukprot:GILJ01017145.1.p1 GENE.GILJ01017145.1~~GILJ01017145.1.p1  ORF type:complete len:184 (+),score=10.07 GILJ01017145.1:174-725(+)
MKNKYLLVSFLSLLLMFGSHHHANKRLLETAFLTAPFLVIRQGETERYFFVVQFDETSLEPCGIYIPTACFLTRKRPTDFGPTVKLRRVHLWKVFYQVRRLQWAPLGALVPEQCMSGVSVVKEILLPDFSPSATPLTDLEILQFSLETIQSDVSQRPQTFGNTIQIWCEGSVICHAVIGSIWM